MKVGRPSRLDFVLTALPFFGKMNSRPLSITVSTSGFHPGNAGSIPAEVTIVSELLPSGAFLLK